MLAENYLDYLTCEVASTVLQEDDEETWVRERMLGIGGSDVGSICGVNKYSSPRLTYLIKTGQYENTFSEESKERMAWGHKLEPIVADTFAERTGKLVVTAPGTFRHKKYKFARANIDRFIVDASGKPIGVLECKTADQRLNKDWAEGEIPMSYIYQLQWYLWILGLEFGAFAALVGGNKFYYYEVVRNDELLEQEILPKIFDFWNKNVKLMIEPDLTGNDADSDFIKDKYTAVDKGTGIELLEDDENDMAVELFEKKQQLKILDKEVKALENVFKEKLQGNETAYTADHIIKWAPRKQVRVDTDKLKSDFPEIFEKCNKTIEYRVFTIK